MYILVYNLYQLINYIYIYIMYIIYIYITYTNQLLYVIESCFGGYPELFTSSLVSFKASWYWSVGPNAVDVFGDDVVMFQCKCIERFGDDVVIFYCAGLVSPSARFLGTSIRWLKRQLLMDMSLLIVACMNNNLII